jgi:DNA primase
MNKSAAQNTLFVLLSEHLGQATIKPNFDNVSAKKQTQFKCFNSKCKSHLKSNKKKLEVNFDILLYHCWVCNNSGSVDKLVRQLFDQEDQKIALAALLEIRGETNINQAFNQSSTGSDSLAILTQLELPQEAIRLTKEFETNLIVGQAIRYLMKRNISMSEIECYGLLYCISGQYANRIIIPSYDSNRKLNFFTGRTIDEQTKLKYLSSNIERKKIVFNEYMVDYSSELVLVEGPFDYLSLHGLNRTALLGSELSVQHELFRKIYENGTKTTIYLDADALEKAMHMASLLISYGIECRIVYDSQHADPSETPRERIVELINDTEKYKTLRTKADLLLETSSLILS